MSHILSRHAYAIEKAPVHLWAKVSFGAAGVPTLAKTSSRGVTSITRQGAGAFTFTFDQAYPKFFSADAVFEAASASGPAAPELSIKFGGDLTATAAATLAVQTSVGGVLTDPASTEVGHFHFILSTTSV